MRYPLDLEEDNALALLEELKNREEDQKYVTALSDAIECVKRNLDATPAYIEPNDSHNGFYSCPTCGTPLKHSVEISRNGKKTLTKKYDIGNWYERCWFCGQAILWKKGE